ncbi:MAG TPA: TIGR03085 family metal-binding protein [Actinomycetes bacterium]|nr:TIGR03085 family metal-binding protein [Actinomycetes bacterium]
MSDDRHSRTLAHEERLELAALLAHVGPDAATLCEGWATRDLAAHLVLREGSVAAAGIKARPLSGWTLRTQQRLAHGDYGELVSRFRDGPPPYSVMRLPGAEAALSTFEHYVHHEDVRRASASVEPRTLSAQAQGVLWRQLVTRARWYLRGAPVPVRLVSPDFGTIEVRGPSSSGVTVTGLPGELVLHVTGRREHADVEVTGTDAALEAWTAYPLHG